MKRILILLSISFLLIFTNDIVNAQTATPIECGTILETELTATAPENRYSFNLGAGDTITIIADALGDSLYLNIYLYDSANDSVESDTAEDTVEITDFILPYAPS